MNDLSIPQDWSLKSIGETCDILDSQRIPLNNEQRVAMKGRFPYYGANGLVDNINSYIFDEDLILIAEDGGFFDDFRNRPIAYKISGKSWVNNHAHVLKAKKDVSQDFIFYAIEHKDITFYISGGTRQKLNQSQLKKIPFAIPNNSLEQRAIADILSTLDEAIAQSESLVQKYQSIKQGLMSDLLTRGVDENGDIRDPERFVETSIGNFPKTWTITSLGNLVLKNGGFIQTGPFGSQLHSHEYVEQGIPVVMPQDIMEDGKISEDNITRITAEKAKELSRHIVKPNDVVFARRGDLSRCSAITEHEAGWLCGTGSMLIRPPQKEIDGRWLAAVYRHEICQHQIRARAVGSTMVNLNSTLLRDLIIPRPPLKEQTVIMEIIESQDKLLSAEVDNVAKLRLLKQGLMQDLLNGQVRVNSFS